MSEGGRKVWNRQQLEELNDGAIILGFIIDPWGPQVMEPLQKQSYDPNDQATQWYEFGSGTVWHTDHIRQDYPIDVIWEPTA